MSSIIAEIDDLIGDFKASNVGEVKLLIKHVTSLLDDINIQERSSDRMIRAHNIYTIYTLLFLNYSTGYRGVKNPLQNFEDYDASSKSLLIKDKDNVDGYMTRVVYVPSGLAIQLEYYSEYRKSLMNMLNLINRGSKITNAFTLNFHPNLLSQCNSTEIEAIKSTYHKRDYCFPFLFFLKKNMGFNELTPSKYLDLLSWKGLEDNSGRHFFRTYLVQHDCRTEVIDAAMGHWKHGNEPYGPYSCLSPHLVKQEIMPYLENMVQECGWKAIGMKL